MIIRIEIEKQECPEDIFLDIVFKLKDFFIKEGLLESDFVNDSDNIDLKSGLYKANFIQPTGSTEFEWLGIDKLNNERNKLNRKISKLKLNLYENFEKFQE